jgi:hypothetical protein
MPESFSESPSNMRSILQFSRAAGGSFSKR